jgi:hypothetical protein
MQPVKMSTARQRLGIQVSTVTNMHATTEPLETLPFNKFNSQSKSRGHSLHMTTGIRSGTELIRLEHRPKLFKNCVLRRMLGPKSDEVTGG